VRRSLIRSNAFIRDARRLAKKDTQAARQLLDVLTLLEEDAFQPKLKTHKLRGDLVGSWACSAGPNLRVVFEFIVHEETEAILLESVGTHDEVY
jgi:mRNA interferase YafQ